MIEVRRKRHENELHEKYMQLYHNEQCYEELMQSLEEAYQNRPAELRRLDNKREKEPNWYRNRNMLGITMYPKLFAGGLNGVIEHLDYLSEQKITYLHLMPLLKMPHPYNDGGYAVEDFKQVDPEIGTNEELEKLTKELRKRGISLCLDVVMNHTADTHEWAMRAKRGEQEYMDRYQCYETREIPDQFEKTMPQVFPETAPGNFTWCEEMHRHVLTTFYPYQWENAEKRKKPGTVQYAIWNGLKQMEEFRREENCFGETAGISTWDTGNSSVFAIRRTAGREELICLANFSEYGQNAWLNCLEGEYEDLFTGEKLEMNSVWMNPYQYRWCVKK